MRGFIHGRVLILTGGLLMGMACTQPVVKHEASDSSILPAGPSDDRHVLAGDWEYEDGFVVTLSLDELGNGSYPWKDGRFETIVLAGRTWHGMWSQRENDREGRFTVEFSPDFSEGEGSWWYTRIGEDRSPSEKGGTFHLTKQISQARTGESQSPLTPGRALDGINHFVDR